MDLRWRREALLIAVGKEFYAAQHWHKLLGLMSFDVWILNPVAKLFAISWKDFKSLFKLLLSGKSHQETSFRPASVCRTELHILLTPPWWLKVSGDCCSVCACGIATVSLAGMAAVLPFKKKIMHHPIYSAFFLLFLCFHLIIFHISFLLFCCGFRLQ